MGSPKLPDESVATQRQGLEYSKSLPHFDCIEVALKGFTLGENRECVHIINKKKFQLGI